MLRRMWNGPGVLVVALLIVLGLFALVVVQYRGSERKADDFADCLMAARSQADMDRC